MQRLFFVEFVVLGSVVQRIVSLTKSFGEGSLGLTVLTNLIAVIILLNNSVRCFCTKASHILFRKSARVFAYNTLERRRGRVVRAVRL